MINSSATAYLPFDTVWKMRIEHPYSLFVREAAILWSCGQCPLDNLGNVLHPGDLLRQAHAVAGFIRRFLGDMQSQASSIGRLVVYYVKTAPGDAESLENLFHQEFGQSVQVMPVAVPHFYYDGMLIEVDVFASDEKGGDTRFVDEESGLTLDVSNAGPFVWATVSSSSTLGQEIGSQLSRLLARANLSRDTLLAEQWFLPVGCAVPEAGLSVDQGRALQNAVRISDMDAGIMAELTFAKAPVSVSRRTETRFDSDGLSISLRMTGDHFHVTALDASPDRGLVEQTASIMKAVETVFADAGLSFRDVRKATTYYIAGSSADDLHDNMSVRNRYYEKPGPASTGLPVEGLQVLGAQISISLFGVMPRRGR
jgi:enamine deaminase RidA (YjgF/YER057c/UK114 family)